MKILIFCLNTEHDKHVKKLNSIIEENEITINKLGKKLSESTNNSQNILEILRLKRDEEKSITSIVHKY
jgi:predicted DNA-binding ribbon-helix-helix protein